MRGQNSFVFVEKKRKNILELSSIPPLEVYWTMQYFLYLFPTLDEELILEMSGTLVCCNIFCHLRLSVK